MKLRRFVRCALLNKMPDTRTVLLLITAFVLPGCASRTNVNAPPKWEEAMAESAQVPLRIGSPNYFVTNGSERIEVKRLPLESMMAELPVSFRARKAIALAEEAEWRSYAANGGRDPSVPFDYEKEIGWRIKCFRASDGIEFLVDDSEMALWYRRDNKGDWTCALSNLNIVKTMGGIAPHLPICYVGDGRFLIAKTLPGRIFKEEGWFPQALCATYLIDCTKGSVIARTKSYVYDHNPWLTLPREWVTIYGFDVERQGEP